MPAIFQTLPCKPIMFDLAHNYLTVPRFDVQVCRCILLYQIPFVKISYVRFIDSFLTQVAFKGLVKAGQTVFLVGLGVRKLEHISAI